MIKIEKAIIPLEIVSLDNGIHIAVHCKAGRYKIPLLIDTGASQSIFDINHKAFANLDFKTIEEPMKSSGINSEIPEIHTANIRSIRIGEIFLQNMPALFMSFQHINSMYKSMKKEPIAGILGGDFLMFYEAEISYCNSEMSLKLN